VRLGVGCTSEREIGPGYSIPREVTLRVRLEGYNRLRKAHGSSS
jgi:hypothetical protein